LEMGSVSLEGGRDEGSFGDGNLEEVNGSLEVGVKGVLCMGP
jgi:hypothetical protein